MTEHKLLSPCPFCGEKLFLDIDEGGGVAILHSLKEKDCFFPSILEIEMPVGTTLEQMIEKINRRPIQESFEHAIAEIEELGAQEAERKEFCPNCEAVVPCTHEAELFVCDICGEDFAKYIVLRNCNVSDVSTTQDVTTPEPPEGACGMSEISEKAIKKDVPFITYIIHDKNMKNGRTVTVYKPTQEYYILFELIKFRRLPSTFPDIGITVISEGLEPSPSDVSVTEDVLIDVKTPRSIENNNPDYYKDDVGKWIPIASGRLPEKFQECIVLDKNKRVHNWIHYDALLPLFAQFTHWMPLPELPEVTE